MILTVIKVIVVCIAVLAVLYMLAIMPRMFNRPDTTLFQKVYFAHRYGIGCAGDKGRRAGHFS